MRSSRGVSFRHPELTRGWSAQAPPLPSAVAAFAAAWLVCSFASRAAAQGSGQGPVSAASNVSTANEERERVILLVRTANDEGVMNRVRAELGASAWRILELRLDERLAKVSLGKLSAQQQARAAVRFSAAEARVELWVSAPAGNIEETLDASDQRDDDAVVALRISEALRARGLNLGPETKAESESGAASEARREGGAKPSVARSKPAANDVRERANRRAQRNPRSGLHRTLSLPPPFCGGRAGEGGRTVLTPAILNSLIARDRRVAAERRGPLMTANDCEGWER